MLFNKNKTKINNKINSIFNKISHNNYSNNKYNKIS